MRRQDRPSKVRLLAFNCLILVACFAFVGLWHGLHREFLYWGLGLGVVIALEKFVIDWVMRRRLDKHRVLDLAWRVVGPVYTCVVVSVLEHRAMNGMMGYGN